MSAKEKQYPIIYLHNLERVVKSRCLEEATDVLQEKLASEIRRLRGRFRKIIVDDHEVADDHEALPLESLPEDQREVFDALRSRVLAFLEQNNIQADEKRLWNEGTRRGGVRGRKGRRGRQSRRTRSSSRRGVYRD